MADPLNTSNDVSSEYLAQRQEVSADDVIAAARARVAPKAPVSPPDANPGSDPGLVGRPGPIPDLKLRPYANPNPFIRAEGGVMATVKAAGRDFVGGVVEAPRQIVGGVSDAIHNALSGVSAVGDWLNEHVADLRVSVPSTGIKLVDDVLADPLKAAAGDKNEVDPAATATGAMVRDVSRFLTGFIPLFRGAKALGMGHVAAGAVAGGAADAATKDPLEENFANLLKSYPALQSPVTDFLSSDPEDGEALARFKKGLEGAGLGLLADGFIVAAKAIVQARRGGGSVSQAADALAEQRGKYGDLTDRDFMFLGDPNQEAVKIVGKGEPEALGAARRGKKLTKGQTEAADLQVPDAVAAKGLVLAGESGGKDVFVNFARIAEPGDVKKVIGQMADAFAPSVNEARRGVRTNAETIAAAEKQDMGFAELLNRRHGQAFNAEEALGARKLWAASAAKLTEAAKLAAAPNAGAVDQFNFRRMMAVHYAVQAEVIGARTETARALQAWSIPVGGGVEKARQVQQLLDQMGGASFSKATAQRLAALEASGATPDAIDGFVRKSWAASTMGAVQEAWVNALLSSPKTHIVNVTSNIGTMFQQIAERGIAAKLSSAMGGETAPGEAIAMSYGLITGLKDAFKLSAKALRSGETGQALSGSPPGSTGGSLGKVDLPREHAIQGDWLRESGHNGVAAFVDLLGTTARVPSRLLGAEDEFFKSVGYRMELHAQSLRQAHAEGARGPDLARRMAEIVAAPPEHIRLSAADAALYSTFSNATGGLGQALLNFREKVPLTVFVMPFIRTPVNIARYAFERSPLAPLVGQWRDDIAAGGARAELALARMGSGSAIMLVAADYADKGLVSGAGPKDAGEREALQRQGWQPYSIRVGKRWVSYNRADPFGMTMGFAADLAEQVRRAETDPDKADEAGEIIAMAIAAVSNVVIDKTYMQGLANVIEALDEPERFAPDYIDKLLGSFVPAVVNAAEGMVDPQTSQRMKIGDAVLARIPFLSANLTPSRDLWGQVKGPSSGFGVAYDALAPIQVSKVKESAIDQEMVRLGADIERVKKRLNWDGVDVNLRDWPQVYDDYVRLAGNELKHPVWNLGAKDFLDRVVAGKHEISEIYNTLADTSDPVDGGKAGFIAKTIGDYRRFARRAVIENPEHAEFAQAIGASKEEKQEKKMPGQQNTSTGKPSQGPGGAKPPRLQ